jgi:hypothetical protein
VGLAWLTEDVRRDDLALIFADVSQQPHPGHVADRPHPLARAQPRVDRDAARSGRNAHPV